MGRTAIRITAILLAAAMLAALSGCGQPGSDPAGATVHPQTQALQAYRGKVISVLGDSISTFAGYIPVADGFNLKHRPRYPQEDLLTNEYETWWMQTIMELDAKLGINDSWAGSRVLNTMDGNSGDLGEDAAMASLTRIRNLGSNGTPDVILFFGGTNDIGNSVPLGSFDPATAPKEADLRTTKWNDLAQAYTAAILRLQHFYPDALIVAILPPYLARYYTDGRLDQYSAVLSQIAEHYGVPVVDLRYSGVEKTDLPDGIHPNAKGMDAITAQVKAALLELCDMEPGEHVVHTVRHQMLGAIGSKSYIKGISHGGSFHEHITGTNKNIRVIMGGEDVTDRCYRNGIVWIEAVTDYVVIKTE